MPATNKKQRGQEGEDFATQVLKNEGLKIILRNYRCPVGEMDIIAAEGDMLIFVEVRTRTSPKYGWGEESILVKKKLRLQRIAEYYILSRRYKTWPSMRLDLIAVRWDEDTPQYQWIRGI